MENCEACKTSRIKKRSEEERKTIISRLNRIIGQLNGVKTMVENDRYCDDVLIQLSAADKAIKSLANFVLDGHMHTCLIEHVKAGDTSVVDEIVELFKRFQ